MDQNYVAQFDKYTADPVWLYGRSIDGCETSDGAEYQINFEGTVYKDGVEREEWSDAELSDYRRDWDSIIETCPSDTFLNKKAVYPDLLLTSTERNTNDVFIMYRDEP